MVSYGPHGRKADNWWGANIPATGPVGTSATWVGIQFGVEVPGRINGVRCFLDQSQDGGYWCICWNKVTVEVIFAYKFRMRPTGTYAWHNTWIRPWIRPNPANVHMLAVLFPAGLYFRNNSALTSDVTRNNITFQKGFQSTSISPPTATITLNNNANAIDVLFQPD